MGSLAKIITLIITQAKITPFIRMECTWSMASRWFFHLDCTLGVGPLSTIATVCCMKMYHAFVCKLLPRPTNKWEGLPRDSWISSFRHCTVELASVCTFQVRPLAKHTDTSIGQIWPDCSSKINTHRGTSIHRGVKWVPGKCSQSSCFHNIESNAWLCHQKL